MKWPRRRWGFTVVTIIDGREMDRHDVPMRYWTRAGVEEAADHYRGLFREISPARLRIEVVVSKLPPPVDYYADQYWQGDVYIGPE